jgi:hypothetical protein
MEANFYKLSGLLAFLIAWSSMLLAVLSQGSSKGKSISTHIASNKKTILLLGALIPIAMVLLIIFVIKYVAPLLGLSTMFIALNVVAYLGYILAAWVPATGGNRTKLHNIFSYGASVLLVPITMILVASPLVATIPKIISSVFLATACVFGYLFWRNSDRANFL